MKDGPVDAEGVYECGEQTYRLGEAASGIWSVYLDDTYLGVLRVRSPKRTNPVLITRPGLPARATTTTARSWMTGKLLWTC